MKIKGIEIDGVVYELGRPIAADPDYNEEKHRGQVTIYFEEMTE